MMNILLAVQSGLTLVQFVVILIVGGVIWYLVENYVPLPDPVKLVLRVVLVLVLVLMILALFGIMPLPFPVS
jgi:hypothetical protein